MKFNQFGFSLPSVLVAAGLLGVVSLGVINLTKQTTQAQRDFSGSMEATAVLNEIRTYLSDTENCTETFQGRNAINDSSAPNLTALRVKNNTGTFVDKFNINEKYGQGIIRIENYALSDPGTTSDDVDVATEGTTYLLIDFYIGQAATRSRSTKKVKLKVEVDSSDLITTCVAVAASSETWTKNPSDVTEIFYDVGQVGIGLSDPEAALDINGGVKLSDSPDCNASLNGLMKFDGTKMLICEDATWRPMSNAAQSCPTGEYLRGFQADGSLDCAAVNTLSETQYFEVTAPNGTTNASQALGNWKFCALSKTRTTEDDSNNYDHCEVSGSFNSNWNLLLNKHSQDQLWCGAVCIR
ncbi:MAG: hypothetical protein CME63_11665 [Halobacteriovoraceae bacterium]|nr:hypothetical protein [Halobacteriovoraceae bacterium]MBC98401.1 hypothetical protein [Halobacteriovoraceae bacterium]